MKIYTLVRTKQVSNFAISYASYIAAVLVINYIHLIPYVDCSFGVKDGSEDMFLTVSANSITNKESKTRGISVIATAWCISVSTEANKKTISLQDL